MDSVTQILLGAAVGEAVLGRRVGRDPHPRPTASGLRSAPRDCRRLEALWERLKGR